MPDISPVEYAASPRVASSPIARSGTGATDLLLINDWFSHVGDLCRPESPFLPVLERLGSFASARRVRQAGRRHVRSAAVDGCRRPRRSGPTTSGRCSTRPGSSGWPIVAKGAGGTMAMLFAATHPDRVASIALVNGWARLSQADDFPIGVSESGAGPDARVAVHVRPVGARGGGRGAPARRARVVPAVRAQRGQPEHLHGDAALAVLGRRAGGAARRCAARSSCCRSGAWIGPGHGRYLAEHLPIAQLVELPGATDLLFAGDTEALVAPHRGVRHRRRARRRPPTGCWPPCSTPTSSTRPSRRAGWATAAGSQLLDRHDGWCGARCEAGARATRSSTPGDGFLPPSTDRRGRSAAPRPSAAACRPRPRGAGRACTPARSNCEATTSAASRCTSAPGSAALAAAGRDPGVPHGQGPRRRVRHPLRRSGHPHPEGHRGRLAALRGGRLRVEEVHMARFTRGFKGRGQAARDDAPPARPIRHRVVVAGPHRRAHPRHPARRTGR